MVAVPERRLGLQVEAAGHADAFAEIADTPVASDHADEQNNAASRGTNNEVDGTNIDSNNGNATGATRRRELVAAMESALMILDMYLSEANARQQQQVS